MLRVFVVFIIFCFLISINNRVATIESAQLLILDRLTELNSIQDVETAITKDASPIIEGKVEGRSAIQIEQTELSVAYEELDYFCLAKNIFHEASIEDELGMYAVAQVTLNRVSHPNYPDSVCEVVMQSGQFSWANNRSRRWSHPEGPKWTLAKQISVNVLRDGYRVPALDSAIYYHADYVEPNWKDPDGLIAQIGTHIFYETAL